MHDTQMFRTAQKAVNQVPLVVGVCETRSCHSSSGCERLHKLLLCPVIKPTMPAAALTSFHFICSCK